MQLYTTISYFLNTLYDIWVQMGSERQCGLGSLLPMSCRGRAEAFARRLHTRLRRLGAEPGSSAHEATWLTGPPPPQHPDSDVYFDFDVELESPSSPVDEIPEHIDAVLPTNHRSDPESGCIFSSPVENESPHSNNSDSDATYYDPETDPDQPHSKLSNLINKCHKNYDENHISKNLSKLKLSTPASEIIDHLLQNKSISPDRQSPIRTQPLARENGFADYGSLEKRDSSNNLYSAINFDDCKRIHLEKMKPECSYDEVDHVAAAAAAAPPNGYCNGLFSVEGAECPKIYLTNGDKCEELVEEESKIDLTDCTPKEASIECEQDDENETEKINDESISCDQNEVSQEDFKIDEEDTEVDIESSRIDVDDSTENFHDSEIETEERPQRVRRCSSLRTGKTPPGTPGRKKIVRFADVLGLDLADVKTFMDDIPNIPKSAFEDLRDADFNSSSLESFVQQELPRGFGKRLVPLFQQPGDQSNFLDILNARSVCLENAVVQEGTTLAIYGMVKVRNLDFNKSVQIRYTLDSWKSLSDLQATYVPNSCDGFSDRFQFLLYAHTLAVGQKLEFAVRFMCKGCQFWDNNTGANYVFQCISTGSNSGIFYNPTTISPVDGWHASFY